MSMTVNTGDDADELDDDLDEDRDDDEQDDEDGRPARKGKTKADPDEDDDDDEDQSPEDLKAEIKRLRASLSKANSSGNRRRQQLKEMRAAQKALEDTDHEDDDEEDEKPVAKKSVVGLDAKAAQRLVTKAVSRRERELQEEHTRDLIDTRFESALIKAGVAEKNIRLLMREVDHDELELDPKTRRVDGIDEETDRLRSEFPDLFKAPKSARRRINGGDDRESSSKRKTLTATEKQVLQLTGRAR